MLGWFAQTLVPAAALAVVAILAGRWRRVGPEMRHALWLLVLIKLMMPPFVGWTWQVPARPEAPRPVAIPRLVETTSKPQEPQQLLPMADADLDPRPPSSQPEPALARVPAPPVEACPETEPIIEAPASLAWSTPALADLALGVWLLGTVAVIMWELTRIVRFGRTLRRSLPAPEWLEVDVADVAKRFGVRPPPLRVVAGLPSPLLWCLGRSRLYLPADLVQSLPGDAWRGVIAHEMAHLARRDPWVTRLELAAEALWWWNPLFWVARRRLRDESERACDARVVRAWPDLRVTYARSLIDVCERLSRPAMPSPVLGVGGGGSGASRSLERRLSMILRDPIAPPAPFRAALTLGLLAALTLPAWSLAQQPELPADPILTPIVPPQVPAPPPPGSTPTEQPKKEDAPTSANPAVPLAPPAQPDSSSPEMKIAVQKAVVRRFRNDPEVIALGDKILEVQARLDSFKRLAKDGYDPAVKRALSELDALKSHFNQLWSDRSAAFTLQIEGEGLDRRSLMEQMEREDRFQIDIYRAQRDEKAAELRKAEAICAGALGVVARIQKMVSKNKEYVNFEEITRAEIELAMAEAEREVKKAALASAELIFQRAKATSGLSLPTEPGSQINPAADRDEASLMARRAVLAAELEKAETAKSIATGAIARTIRRRLHAPHSVSTEELDQTERELQVATAEVALKEARLAEADEALRRSSPRSEAPPRDVAVSRSKVVAVPDLADLRETVETQNFRQTNSRKEVDQARIVIDEAQNALAHLPVVRPADSPANSAFVDLKNKIKVAQAKIDRFQADQPEAELRLKQAQRRVDAEVARLQREADRARVQLDRATVRFQAGAIAEEDWELFRDRYDDLMFAIHPDHKPTPIPTRNAAVSTQLLELKPLDPK